MKIIRTIFCFLSNFKIPPESNLFLAQQHRCDYSYVDVREKVFFAIIEFLGCVQRKKLKVASHFGDRLFETVKHKKTGLVVGIDPLYARLPAAITSHRDMDDEFDVAAAIDAIFTFSTKVVRIVAPLVPAVKINIAFFERYLWEGIETYYSLIAEAEELELEVIGDVKRGDIGHTAQSYATAHLENSELTGLEDILAPDAITINGFAGADGIIPFADKANQQGKGVFVWVRASNPSAGIIQDFADASGMKMYEKLAEVVGQIANEPQRIGQSGYSNVGMVIGGTTVEQTKLLRQEFDKIWFLVPGFGSQGASAQDCVKFCKPDGTGALINASRSIIYAYENPQYKQQFGNNWERCIEQAAIDAKLQISRAIQ
jgi:orotidine-5'-phosphate decarboxylase